MKQIVLSLIANAGGVGKTTLSVHIAYEMSRLGFDVAIIDLDPQRSLDVFCGLPPAEVSTTLVKVLSKDFQGDWDLIPIWEQSKTKVCQGHPLLAEIANELVIRKRGEYTLSDRFKKYPLPHNLVILDCPATLGMLNVNALAASTHILVPVQLEMKAISGSAELVEWCISTGDELQLEPRPPILGFVPSMYDDTVAMHRQYLEQLPEIAEHLHLKLYPKVRNSNEFKNASAHGLPLQKYRPKHPACRDFQQITDDLAALIQEKK
ncbi:ParA family protein [Nodularia harveyana UHCC-0300]|uniref:ParA family protein n=1 Tax=Nodularia harveyana UHCC-0300 TaxID=2974287 RepID=A0ABU5UJI2_9CYAN|nr:ParA family protein [Nodularia harveyana]MEA5583732.1 ParA family protein [Nodularia harveyana UHCC-0300]